MLYQLSYCPSNDRRSEARFASAESVDVRWYHRSPALDLAISLCRSARRGLRTWRGTWRSRDSRRAGSCFRRAGSCFPRAGRRPGRCKLRCGGRARPVGREPPPRAPLRLPPRPRCRDRRERPSERAWPGRRRPSIASRSQKRRPVPSPIEGPGTHPPLDGISGNREDDGEAQGQSVHRGR